MRKQLISQTLVSLGLLLAVVGAATAAPPVMIDKTQAAAGARSEAGTGLCGSATHFAAGQPLTNKADATAVMDKPTTDPMILGRAMRLFDNVNFRNGQVGTSGDFAAPMYPEAIFPYSTDATSMPLGTDSNFTLRLRGYFNVPATLAGKTISFGVNCDDFCSLRIGTTELTPPGNQLISARVIKQVTFLDAGLYPIELSYFQNGSTAYLEWSRSDTAVPECPNDVCQTALSDSVKYAGAFKLLPASELYSSVSGANSSCQECGATGVSCAAGNFCGAGLCQTCDSSDHCGTSCQICPTNARQCKNGACVECTADTQCASGGSCNTSSGRCVAPTELPMDAATGCTLGGRAVAARGSLMAGLLLVFAVAGLRRRRGRTA